MLEPRLRDSNMAAGNQWKHLVLKTFLLSVKLENSVAHGHLVWRRHVGATV